MVQSITPSPSVSAARGVGSSAAGATLQAGALLTARVQQVLADNLVQVAIGNLAMELASELPLQAGQTVQVAVSQTPQGLQLAIVGQGGGAAAGTAGTSTPAATVVDVTGRLAPTAPPPDPLTGLERLALSIASEEAATRQGSQGQLFADLQAVAESPNLPPALRAAVAQVLAQQTPLAPTLTGEDIQNAAQSSGVFLEASLAKDGASAGPPDLKAALIVLRQTLTAVLQTADQAKAPTAPLTSGALYAMVLSEAGQAPAQRQSAAPSLAPDLEIELPPQPLTTGMGPAAAGVTASGLTGSALIETLAQARPQSLSPATVLAVLQEAQQQIPRAAGLLPGGGTPNGRGADVVVRTNTPPPPFRGGAPMPQPVAMPTLGPGTPLPAIAHRLLDETDQALSRQTLLQVASLPDRPDASGVRTEQSLPRWNFEIPFATPQGTAMAQFEISRDGGTQAPDAA